MFKMLRICSLAKQAQKIVNRSIYNQYGQINEIRAAIKNKLYGKARRDLAELIHIIQNHVTVEQGFDYDFLQTVVQLTIASDCLGELISLASV